MINIPEVNELRKNENRLRAEVAVLEKQLAKARGYGKRAAERFYKAAEIAKRALAEIAQLQARDAPEDQE